MLVEAKFFMFISTENVKNCHSLPIVRVKKIMKTEDFALQEMKRIKEEQDRELEHPANGSNRNTDDSKKCVFMIAADGPILMAKAAELFIRDISTRAWRHTDTNRRKTIQKSDIIHSTSESETYDFLIDIIPRFNPEVNTTTTNNATMNNTSNTPAMFSQPFDTNVLSPCNADGNVLMTSTPIALESTNDEKQPQQHSTTVSHATTSVGTESMQQNEKTSLTLDNIPFTPLKEQPILLLQPDDTLEQEQTINENRSDNAQPATYFGSSEPQQWTFE
jgi:hypothetical protein